MTDPNYEDDKKHKRYNDMLFFVADSDNGIPLRCPCGGQIVIHVYSSYEDDKKHKRYNDMLFFVADSDNGIPLRCPCGGQIVIHVCKAGTNIGKKYFVYKHFENDGSHRKKEWDEAIEEETKKLTRKVDDHELKIRSLYSIEDHLSRLEEDGKKNAEEIEDLKYFLKNHYPNEFY
ncbi:hypothetical protein F2Q68_00031680 [Brassica cretica]|uniref:Uncharacterized protein n=1 Tax=Brassica cretica TaxID=69181 RepID=A0A8S9G976_BRACR|nr:hypothetical protein F2Q68_00031680 [Brassica cretica]